MLKSKNIFLRKITPKDVDIIFNWENNPRNWQYGDTKTPFTKKEIITFVNEEQNIFKNHQIRYMICLSNEEIAIGCVDLFEFNEETKKAGIGILIGEEEYRNKGYANESLKILINYAKKELALNKLFCNISKTNTTSIRLFTKNGFKFITATTLFGKAVNYYELDLK